MKTLILLALAALPAFAETAVTWNVIDVEKLRAMGVPGITPVTYDGVFVYAEQKEDPAVTNPPVGTPIFGGLLEVRTAPPLAPPSGFVIQVTFADGGVVAHYAPVQPDAGCACAAVTVPFPRGAAIVAPKLVKVYPVYVAAAAEAVEVKP